MDGDIIEDSKFQVLVRVRPVQEEADIRKEVFRREGGDEVCTRHVSNTTVEVGENVYHSNGTYSLEACVGQAVESLEARRDITLLAYGQTSAGKTFTVMEILSSFVEKIIAFSRRLEHEPKMQLQFSAFELLGDSTLDLLSEEDENGLGNVRCLVREDSEGKVHVGNCTAVTIDTDTHEHLQGLIDKAFSRRKTTATAANEASSRSHAFCSFKLSAGVGGESFMIRLIDLAGCERWEDALYHSQERIQEMKAINYSLGCLKECVRLMLASSTSTASTTTTAKAAHIPYRRSKLTMLLKDTFEEGSNGRCSVIAHLAPTRSQLKHSINTMKFVTSILERETLAMKEKKTFSGPLAWSKEEMGAFVASLDGGKYAFLASSFCLTGKLFSVEWIGHVRRRAMAAGGTEADGEAIYDAFHGLIAKHNAISKPAAAAATKKQASSRSGGLSLKERRVMQAKFAATFGSDDVVVVAGTKKSEEEEDGKSTA